MIEKTKKNNNPFYKSLDNINAVYVKFLSQVPLDVKDSNDISLKNNAYDVYIDNIHASLRFERIYNPTPGITGIGYAGGGKLEVDIYGQLSKTMVVVAFRTDALVYNNITDKELNGSDDTKLMLDISLKYLSQFLKKYAEVTGQYWVNPINSKEIISCEIEFDVKSGKNIRSRVPLASPVYFSGGEGHFITEDKDKTLRRSLVNSKPNHVGQLMLSAEDFFHKEEYSLTIIQCAIAFEYFVYNELKKIISNTKIKKATKKADCGCHVGIFQLCSQGLNELLNLDFGSTEQFLDVYKYVIKPRNLIVHGSLKDNISDENACKAISSTKIALHYLDAEFKNYYNKKVIQATHQLKKKNQPKIQIFSKKSCKKNNALRNKSNY